MNPIIQTIRKMPIFSGSLADVARATSLSKGTLSKEGALSPKTKIVIISFLDEMLKRQEKVTAQLKEIIAELKKEKG